MGGVLYLAFYLRNAMGIDIYGWIEIQEIDETWIGAVKINPSLMGHDRNKMMMGFLFSLYTEYPNAIAANRGLPQDSSQEVRTEQEGFKHSWISLAEIQKIEWQERKLRTNQSEFLQPFKQIDENTEIVITGGWKLILNSWKHWRSIVGKTKSASLFGLVKHQPINSFLCALRV
jgi:hypothetical protein